MTPMTPEEAEGGETWNLRLYVAGQTRKSLTALANLQRFCEEEHHTAPHFPGLTNPYPGSYA